MIQNLVGGLLGMASGTTRYTAFLAIVSSIWMLAALRHLICGGDYYNRFGNPVSGPERWAIEVFLLIGGILLFPTGIAGLLVKRPRT